MHDHIIQAARQTAQEATQAFIFDETDLRAIAPALAAPAIYDAAAQHLAHNAVHDIAASHLTRVEYAQLETLFVEAFIDEYQRLASHA